MQVTHSISGYLSGRQDERQGSAEERRGKENCMEIERLEHKQNIDIEVGDKVLVQLTN